jgi:hypothetical protein
MRLPHLDQRVPLHHGEATLLAWSVEWWLTLQVAADSPRSIRTVLAMSPLERVKLRLAARARQEKDKPAPRKPRHFTLRYDEVAALMLILPVAPAAGGAWGAVQQASFRLENVINFAV